MTTSDHYLFIAFLQMTGRKGRIISTVEGNIRYESRAENDVPTELLNLTEKQVSTNWNQSIKLRFQTMCKEYWETWCPNSFNRENGSIGSG